MLAQLSDIHVHTAGIEVVVVNPDGLQSEVTLENLVDVSTKEAQQLALFGGELGRHVINNEHLFLGVESELTYLIHSNLFSFLSLYAAHDGIDTHHELFHREWLGDIVIGTNLEALEDVFLKCFSGEEDYRHLAVDGADFLGELETIFLGHHDIKHANVVLAFKEGLVATLAIGKEVGIITFGLKILSQ